VEQPDIPNMLDREFNATSPNNVWRGDIIYVWADGRWDYLAAVIDLCARHVVGWAYSSKPGADLVIKALGMA
jgi:putative transposase